MIRHRSRKITLEAVYRDGIIQPAQALDIPENTPVHVTVTIADAVPASSRKRFILASGIPATLFPAIAVPKTLAWWLSIAAILIYAASRLIGLPDFPISFFADEAIQTVLAEELVRNGFRDSSGAFFPPYFKNGQVWNLGLSVYVQVLPLLLLGKSVFITRAVSVLVTLFGAAAVSLILKLIFKIRFWWLGILVLAGVPAWFLHSRTAFETVLMVSFYALFLLFYLLYRCRSSYFIYPTLIFAAAAFYAYSNGQAIIGFLGLLLAIVDFRYHWRQLKGLLQLRRWRPLGALLVLIVILALPYLRFRITYPTELVFHLRTLDSYWLQNLSLTEKVSLFTEKYLKGLSPAYWFFPNEHDLVRHRMKGFYGHMRPELLPFLIIGLTLCLWRWRTAPYRVVLLALLVTPVSAAMVDIAITRVLAFVVPASILICLGLEWLLTHLPERPQAVAGLACFGVLSLLTLGMLRNALAEGALWYQDYGMGGMQYGTTQLFEIILEYLAQEPDTQILLTPNWANGADLFPRFFLARDNLARVQTRNVDTFILEKQPLSDKILFIMTPEEYEQAVDSGKFKPIVIEREFPYPDGSAGFYFARLAYVDDVDAIFAAEAAARRRLVEGEIQLHGQRVSVLHSLLDSGSLADMFDGDTFTLGRVMEANPARLEFTFPEPWEIAGMAADFGTMDFRWKISLYGEGESEPIIYEQTYRDLGPDPHVEILFDRGPARTIKLEVQIEDLRAGERAKIHIRELALNTINSSAEN